VQQVNEAEWLNQAINGDPQAFTDLVEAYQRPVFNLCYRMLGTPQDAEDAAQETFLRAYQNMRRYDRSRPFSTWLLSIAAHYCIDQVRKRRRPVVSIEELPVPDLPETTPGLETQLTRKQEQERVQKLLKVLEPTDRAAVVMYYWYDFSYDEICQSLNLSLSAVKSRLHRARRLLAENYQPAAPAGTAAPLKPMPGGERLRVERMTP
jgi:RNA polymerase sigma-70 factor (ECF subfamily)